MLIGRASLSSLPDVDAVAALERIDDLHTALTQLVLEGGDLGRIAQEVARVLGVAILFTSTDGRVQAESITDADRQRLIERDLFDPTGRFRVERAGREGADLRPGWVIALPVVAGGTDLARLVCLRRDASLRADDVPALERAAAVAALLVTREQAVTAVETKYQGDFLRDVFLRRAGAEAYVVEHAEGFGWRLGRPTLVAVAELDPTPAGEPVTGAQRRHWQERFSAAWRQVTHDLEPGVPCVDFSAEVVSLLPTPEGPVDADPLGRDLVRKLVEAVAGDRGGGRRSFSVGVSRVAPRLEDLPNAYAQARRGVEIGRRIRGPGSVTHFDELGIHRLIALVPDPAELRHFTTDVLGPLADTTAEAQDLRETLQVLLDTNFNVAEAARLQFFHYNTMRYRVGKLERLLGPLSTDSHLRLDVAVALRVLDLAV